MKPFDEVVVQGGGGGLSDGERGVLLHRCGSRCRVEFRSEGRVRLEWVDEDRLRLAEAMELGLPLSREAGRLLPWAETAVWVVAVLMVLLLLYVFGGVK